MREIAWQRLGCGLVLAWSLVAVMPSAKAQPEVVRASDESAQSIAGAPTAAEPSMAARTARPELPSDSASQIQAEHSAQATSDKTARTSNGPLASDQPGAP